MYQDGQKWNETGYPKEFFYLNSLNQNMIAVMCGWLTQNCYYQANGQNGQ